jgi:hypothetical protein
MPLFEPVVYPSKRNKGKIEETVDIRNILRPWKFPKLTN